MYRNVGTWPTVDVHVDLAESHGVLELGRHSVGLGGINSLPLPAVVTTRLATIRPRLVRIFVQEFFDPIQPDGSSDWSRFDAYVASITASGARIVAAISLKPPSIFGTTIDQRCWRPEHPDAWRRLVRDLVTRYSVRQNAVTHWEIGNEVDIGEDGGCPFLIPDPADYYEFYEMTIEAILEVWPDAKVGGPGVASVHAPVLEGFIEMCAKRGTRLDFVSHHLYSNEPRSHAEGVRKARRMLESVGLQSVETMVTEFAPWISSVYTVDQAFEARSAGCVAASVIEMLDAGLDRSFYYHLWDQVLIPEEFEPFYSRPVEIMGRHWNEVPHRFGLFGVNGEPRPTWHLYRLLAGMKGERVSARCDDDTVRVLAAADGDRPGDVDLLLVNYAERRNADLVAKVHLNHLRAAAARLVVYRIDDSAPGRFGDEPVPIEVRDTWTAGHYETHVALAAGSVAMVRLIRGADR